MKATVVGAGLAGTEAVWQLVKRGISGPSYRGFWGVGLQ
jgi:folate-dependent tRNA-U54 methylase TrmFO/GidA